MLKTLMKSLREYKTPSLLSPLFVTFEVILECIIPLVMASLIDHMKGASLTPVFQDGIVLIILAMASLYCGRRAAIEAAKGSAGFAKNLRQDLYFNIQSFSFADVDKFSTSSLVTRMTTDVTNVQTAFQMVIRGAVRTPLMIIFSIVMSLTINVRMALIFIAVIPFLAVVLFGIVLYIHPVFVRIFKKYDAMNNSVQENVGGIRVVKSFVREDYEKEKFHKRSGDVCKDFTFAEKVLAWNNPTMVFSISLTMVLVSFIGARIIITTKGSSLSTGQLSSLITYGIQILIAMMMLSMVFVLIIISQESANRIVEVLEYQSTLTSPENGKTEIADGSVEFDNVSFKYSERSKRYALSDVNLQIPSGSSLGIIGGTGSSKTTLIQLISRLYDVTEGVVKVGGTDVRQYDLDTLRNQVAVVLQKNVLFSGTIKDNMRWGDKNATDEQIEHACKLAQADEFIQLFPQKYDTYIEQGGSNVSGGQKQRLCIARALLKKPKILILDDSTSAVDTKTDALIRRAFREEIPDTTRIIIAQRISSVQDCDNIIVLDGGRIVEQGNHDQLIAANGIYKEIFDSQTMRKEEN
ncbi:MAG: ABC transporter ATP-binding protein [Bilifractor sp.]|nr:ABC transporter ATP-binding protein/permease [Lachnospiraceae bacterium]MDY2836358.1 ABC transporter ATP-binding protein [Bilifractor sp.]